MAKTPTSSGVNAAQDRAIKKLREDITRLTEQAGRSKSADRTHDGAIRALSAELDRIIASTASKSRTDRSQSSAIGALQTEVARVAKLVRTTKSRTDVHQDSRIAELTTKVERMSSIIGGLAGLNTIDNILSSGFNNLVSQLGPLRDLTPTRRPLDDGESKEGTHPQSRRLSSLRNSLEQPTWASAGTLGIAEQRVSFLWEEPPSTDTYPDGRQGEVHPLLRSGGTTSEDFIRDKEA